MTVDAESVREDCRLGNGNGGCADHAHFLHRPRPESQSSNYRTGSIYRVSSGADCIISPGRISVSSRGSVPFDSSPTRTSLLSVHPSIHPSIPSTIPMRCTPSSLPLRVPNPSIAHHSPPTGLSVLGWPMHLLELVFSRPSSLPCRFPFPSAPNSEVLFLPLSSHVFVFLPKTAGEGWRTRQGSAVVTIRAASVDAAHPPTETPGVQNDQ